MANGIRDSRTLSECAGNSISKAHQVMGISNAGRGQCLMYHVSEECVRLATSVTRSDPSRASFFV
jgi:hypothetical protein